MGGKYGVGVYFADGRYNVRIRGVHLGRRSTPEAAQQLYDAACWLMGLPIVNQPNRIIPLGLKTNILPILVKHELVELDLTVDKVELHHYATLFMIGQMNELQS